MAAPVFRFGPPDPIATLWRLRALDAVFGAATLLVGFFVARTVFSPALAASVPLTLAGIPMFTAVSGGLSADPLSNLLAALTLLVLARRVCAPPHAHDRWAIIMGVLLGLGVLTKLGVGIFVPLALLTIAFRSPRAWRESFVLLATSAIVVSPWLLHQVTTYGWTDPLALNRHSSVVFDQPRFPGLSPDYVVQFLTISFHSFWAQFGWMAIVAAPRLYWAWGVLTLLAVVGLALFRGWTGQPVWRLLLATVLGAFAAYLVYNLAFEQPQGRYLFTAIVPLAMFLVSGWNALTPTRARPAGALAIGIVLVGLNAYALTRVLVPGFGLAS